MRGMLPCPPLAAAAAAVAALLQSPVLSLSSASSVVSAKSAGHWAGPVLFCAARLPAQTRPLQSARSV